MLSILAIVIMVAFWLSLTAIALGSRKPRPDRSPTNIENPLGQEAKFGDLFADTTVRVMMNVDRVDGQALAEELSAMSLQLRKNAGPPSTFGRSLCRLQNLSQMLDRLGWYTCDEKAVSIGPIFTAFQTCAAEEVCHDWLLRADKSFEQAPAFCLNAERFVSASRAA